MDTSRLPDPLRRKLEARLERLPAELRGTLEAQLARLPVAQLEAALDRASPLIDRLLGATRPPGGPGAKPVATVASAARAAAARGDADSRDRQAEDSATMGGARAAARADEAKSHFNRTVQRGDANTPPVTVMVAVLAAVALVTWMLGWWTL